MNIFKQIHFIVLFFSLIKGQGDYSFKNISVEDGLAESTVKIIYESKQGFLFFGTENGLDIFDGYKFKNYHMDSFDNKSILGNKVSAIYESDNNLIWVGSELGFSSFNPVTQKFTRPSLNNSNIANPEKITEDKNGKIWIKEVQPGRLFTYDFNRDILKCISCDQDKVLFDQTINNLHKANNGTLWIGTNEGLYFHDINDDLIKSVESEYPLSIKKPYNVTSIESGLDNVLWVGTKQGLVQIDEKDKSKINLFKNSRIKNSIVSNVINDIEWDSLRKELWISTIDGISKYSLMQKSFSNIQVGPFANSIIENDVTDILIAEKSGTLWFKTRNRSGINSFKATYSHYDGPDTSIMHFEHDPIDPFSIADNE